MNNVKTTRSSSIATFGNTLLVTAIILLFAGGLTAFIGAHIFTESYGGSPITLYAGIGTMTLSIPTYLWSHLMRGFSHVVRAAEVYYQEKGVSSPEVH